MDKSLLMFTVQSSHKVKLNKSLLLNRSLYFPVAYVRA